jgi:AcrR family transcriptional regulator
VNGTRQRIIDASAHLMRHRGYEATGVKAIVTAARAPFGSIYHFFPGGKEELGAEYGKLLPAVLGTAPDLVSGVRAFFAGAAAHLVATDYADACPIATIALEVSNRSEVLRQACAEVFDEWIALGSSQLVAGGVPETDARGLVIEMIAALEGAFVLCRATRSTEALDVVGAAAASSVAAALSSRPTP